MNHSWRHPPLPPIPGNTTNLCPICSISHFPFCLPHPPPPPSFIENPRFHYPQPQNNYYHQPPRFDHPPPPPPPSFPNHQSSLGYNSDYNHVGRRPSWYGSNPSLDMSPYDGYGYDGYGNGGIKRMKIEAIDNNGGPRGSFADTSRVSSDSERILKLIHDHGNAAIANTPGSLPKVGVDNNVHYDQRDELGQPHFDRMQHHLPPNYNSRPPYSYYGQPPLPASPPPPPPPPMEPPRNHFFEPHALSPAKKPSLFPIAVSSSADSTTSRSVIPENHSSAHVYYTNNTGHHASTLPSVEESHIRQSLSEKHVRGVQPYPLRNLSSEKPNIIDASHIFKHPHRASRPDHLVIILRGLPGSGKSYLAKLLRDIEVENGGEAPRIHSMDEYFMTEVEKAEDSELSKSSGSLRGKRQVMKKVMEYCYEPEMEEAYRASMLKAFKKTLDEGVYSFIIVDDRNLRVADFAQFWATAKRSGYEVYIVEAAYKDPAGCAARNVHKFTLEDIQKMAQQWEEAPSLYLKMDIKSLLHGDGFDASGIQEVDMDMDMEDDDDAIDTSLGSNVKSQLEKVKDPVDDCTPHDEVPLKDVKHLSKNHQTEVNHLSQSKWSNDLDESESREADEKKKGGSLSGLIQAYKKDKKSVQWGDQGGNIGFSISATRKTNTKSLVIGPGSGYNLKSNPLSEEERIRAIEPKSQNVFQERIRAERESFKAVFDKRRQRIGGFNMDDE